MEARPARRAGARTATTVARREFCGLDEIALLGEMAGTKLGRDRVRWLRVQGAWSLAVGWHLRRVTRACSLIGDTLTVEVRDRAWLTELERIAPKITARLGELIPADPVRNVVFRIGPLAQGAAGGVPMKGSAERAGKARPVNGSAMHVSLETVGDECLRDRLRVVMDRYLHAKRAG